MRYVYLIEGYRNENGEESSIDMFASSKRVSFSIANRFLFELKLEKVKISRVAKNCVSSKIEVVKIFKKSDVI